MKIPDDLRKLVNKLTAGESTEERKRREAAKASRIAAEAERRKRIKDGLCYAILIFEWAREFRNSRDGKRIIKLGERTFLAGIMFFDDKLEGRPFRGLGVSAKRLWWIRSGCGAYPQIVRTPEELAGEIDTEILMAAWENIKSGKVWECIKNRWELNEKK